MRATTGQLPWAGLAGRRWTDVGCLFVNTGFELSCYSRRALENSRKRQMSPVAIAVSPNQKGILVVNTPAPSCPATPCACQKAIFHVGQHGTHRHPAECEGISVRLCPLYTFKSFKMQHHTFV